jgi:hypothetical protein
MSGGGNLPIGPGIWGFIAFFLLAIALWLLVRNMNTRLRRMAYRDRDRAEELQARSGGTDTADIADAADSSATDAPEPTGHGGEAHGGADEDGPATDGSPRT